ncbi:aminoglycoside phosphotransferase family protein [Streptomyces sp. DSM 44915]|uniref:Aminoglycoside phosphotransferase family protein n=1 Tax=Streptomyces chisholmiae TaxID=3075540 RepID=A0ABU2JT59_9ACTN|nr:aminoglycoside phosphotransferase family protein [Streptomyces sp. DSM 44915]MDT0267383.1 aminoglycoside phosphotransferase family protein [Streptomyces sp. DSM 44915]
MESVSKNRQSPAALRAMIERAYGPERVPVGDGWATELTFGWFNVAYRVRLRDGAEVVLKIAPPPHVDVMTHERDAMGTELRALELIRAHTDVPVAAAHFADHSRELCDASYFCMPYVHGENLGVLRDRLSTAEHDAYLAQLGARNREINAVRGAAFGPLAGPGDASWRRVFTGMVEHILADGERRAVALGWDHDTIRAVLAEHADSLDEVTEPRLVEWDLWDPNVLVRDGRIVCVIDHERAFFGDPLMERLFGGTQLPAFGPHDAFMRGYGHPPLTPTEQTRRRLYCLYLVLVLVVETVYREHEGTATYDWARTQLDHAMALFGRTR